MFMPRKFVALAAVASTCIALSGCGAYSAFRPASDTSTYAKNMQAAQQKSLADMSERSRFQQDLQNSPDLPAWHNEREKMALAIGDRTLDKNFDDTFDAMITALANLGCRVSNMERVSGFITSSLPELPPELAEQLNNEARAEYAQARGYSPAVLQAPTGPMAFVPQFTAPQATMTERMASGVTLTVARLGGTQTRVKLRFNGVYYPRKVEELYRRVWDAVDKQMFLNRTIG